MTQSPACRHMLLLRLSLALVQCMWARFSSGTGSSMHRVQSKTALLPLKLVEQAAC